MRLPRKGRLTGINQAKNVTLERVYTATNSRRRPLKGKLLQPSSGGRVLMDRLLPHNGMRERIYRTACRPTHRNPIDGCSRSTPSVIKAMPVSVRPITVYHGGGGGSGSGGRRGRRWWRRRGVSELRRGRGPAGRSVQAKRGGWPRVFLLMLEGGSSRLDQGIVDLPGHLGGKDGLRRSGSGDGLFPGVQHFFEFPSDGLFNNQIGVHKRLVQIPLKVQGVRGSNIFSDGIEEI